MKCCLHVLLIVAVPDGFTLGEEPARRLAKKYDTEKDPHTDLSHDHKNLMEAMAPHR